MKPINLKLNVLILISIISYVCPFDLAYSFEKVTQIRVLKNERELQLWSGDNLVKRYPIKLSLGYHNPFFTPGSKRREGDMQTPVGHYKIIKKRTKTKFPKSLLINYPNKEDRLISKSLGIPEDQLGGMILIHGAPYRPSKKLSNFLKNLMISEDMLDDFARNYFYPFYDWTAGCIAVSDDDMDEIFELIKVGTPINIYP